jgi:hypothetical protein
LYYDIKGDRRRFGMLLLPIIIHVAGRKRHYLAIAAQSHLVVRVASTEILAGGGGGGASIFDADNIISSGDDARILVSGVSLEQASLCERRI